MTEPLASQPPADIDIQIEPAGDNVDIVLRAGYAMIPQQGLRLARPPLTLEGDARERLHRGHAPASDFTGTVASLTDWLLGDGFGRQLAAILRDRPEHSVRLVLTVSDERLTDLPLELVRSPEGPGPLGLDPRVASIVYVPPAAPVMEAKPKRVSAPIRVLIVRSNPEELGGNVPEALPIRDALFAAKDLNADDLIEVDVLSREQGGPVLGPPVFNSLRANLKRHYDILVYLGHGNLVGQSAVLELENADGKKRESVNAEKLAATLGEYPIPVVLLVGCVTAVDALRERIEADDALIARWMRGSQNLAQSLVERNSGVEVAVGMRSQLETEAAERFLTRFFRSFLKDHPGHVEAALHATREELANSYPGLLTWLAPQAYRVHGTEPMFQILAQMAAVQQPDVGQALMHVKVRDDKVFATTQGIQGPDEREAATVGEELLLDTVKVLERWLRDNRFTEREQFKVLGKLLYRLLFNGEVGKLFDRTLARLDTGERLLVRLSFANDALGLAGLPWEYLYAADQQPGFFFASFGDVSLILSRYAPIRPSRRSDPTSLLPAKGKLRILLVISRLKAGPLTKSAEEMKGAFERLAEGYPIEVSFLESPDTYGLTETIRRGRPHVVHFVGHGRRKGREQEILLSSYVSGESFAMSLAASEWRPRIVFLQLTDWSRQNAQADFARMAPRLIENDARAVVAMRYPITNLAAKSFSDEFYPKLAAGAMIDAAVQAALTEMLRRTGGSYDDRLFGTPVFYIQRPDRIMQPRTSPIDASPGPGDLGTPRPPDTGPEPGVRAASIQRPGPGEQGPRRPPDTGPDPGMPRAG